MQHHGGTSNETTAAATKELTDLMGRSVEATGHAGQVHLKPPVRTPDHAANGGRRSPSPTRSGLSSSATDGGAMWTCSLDVAEHESPSALYTSTLRTSHHAVRVDVASDRTIDAEKAQACNLIIEALQLRKKYLFVPKVPEWERPDAEEPFQPDWEGKLPPATSHTFKCIQGVFHAYDNEEAMAKDEPSHDPILPLVDFHRDYHRLLEICNAGPVKTFSYERLKVLEYRWHFHSLLNAGKEILSSQTDDPKDFSNVAKVDTHIHLAAAMTSKHLLSFIKRKIRDSPNDEVLTDKEGKPLTLQQFISTLGLKIDEFTVDSLDVRADNTFNRFEIFNSKYSPFGFSELRTIFMKTENMQDGRYFAELTKELCSKLEVSECCFAEWRVSVYGSKRSDWDNLAKWVVSHRVYSDHNRWIVQVPRIYNIFKKAGQVKHFQEFLDNLFIPLFEVTIDPSSHPELHIFLKQMSGFDSVDDESKLEIAFSLDLIPASPEEWTSDVNPPYVYYMYYMWANLYALNRLRESKGLNTFSLRPHCGESGDVDHLAAAFMLAQGINHGINLARKPPLEYLYYLAQIGLAISPLSNNALFLDYKRNPFPMFFKRGLNVSLSTDDPLQFHFTQNPLIEEYAIVSQRWKLNYIDLCELARNSVLQSGFEHAMKVKWLGPTYFEPGVNGNDIKYTNVPDIRTTFRHLTLTEEREYIRMCVNTRIKKPPTRESSAIMRTRTDYTKLGIDTQSQRIDPALIEQDLVQACEGIKRATALRAKYVIPNPYSDPKIDPNPPTTSEVITRVSGVYHVYASADSEPIYQVRTLRDFIQDYDELKHICSHGGLASFALERLQLLESRFNFHTLMNSQREKEAMKFSHKDFYHLVRVDTHVHAASAMGAHTLLQFIKEKYHTSGDEIVIAKGNQTLKQIFDNIGTPIEHFTLDSLDVSAGHDTFGRFDRFNTKYNPFGRTELRTIFLKKENDIKGKYFGQLLRRQLDVLERNPYEVAEWRISVYGRKKGEWSYLAQWVEEHNLWSDCQSWVVQVPRIFHLLRDSDGLQSFQEMLDNLFLPLFEVTRDPSSDPLLHKLLTKISSFDSVDDENAPERKLSSVPDTPSEWNTDENPPYGYYLYYMWANITSLNHYRQLKNMNTFLFRPHSGSSGSVDHLASAYLLANNISHGINLRKSHPLQYLFYLSQIGISMSPLSESSLFLDYSQNVFLSFFKRGLHVSLSTDNPLQLHTTDEPLMEEYAIAATMFRLNITDMSEIARNSVLMSGFPHHSKKEWLGDRYFEPGTRGNDPTKSNLPNIRVAFRQDNLMGELSYIDLILQSGAHKQKEKDLSLTPLKERLRQSLAKQADKNKINSLFNDRKRNPLAFSVRSFPSNVPHPSQD